MKLNHRIEFIRPVISIDLETTGLSQEKDKIIEIGAVKYDQSGIKLTEFETYTNPEMNISTFVEKLTGISNKDVNGAPLFTEISESLETFLSDSIIIGHNVGFDKGFLNKNGLDLDNVFIDTWRLAQILLPDLQDLSLGGICKYIGIEQQHAHRAKYDAQHTMEVFTFLLNKFDTLDPKLKTAITNTILKNDKELYFLFNTLMKDYEYQNEFFSLLELISNDKDNSSATPSKNLNENHVDEVFREQNEILKPLLPDFSYRKQQHEMSKLVFQSINEKRKIAVEAGTGVGKSLAYLLPSAIYSLNTSKKVIISTNTINLQEQLYSKDLPIINKILKKIDLHESEINFCTLKGRDNYLCLNTLSNQLIEDNEDVEYGRFLAKILVWLAKTENGDKSELGLSNYVDINYWRRVTHKNSNCFGKNSGCFLYESKLKAEKSNIIVVNHALLMTDLKSINNLIPNYEILIIDEAHNLEDVASQHLGWKIDEREIRDLTRLDIGKINILDTIEKVLRKEFKGSNNTEYEQKVNLYVNKLKTFSEESELKLKDFINSINIAINSEGTKNIGHKTLRVRSNGNLSNKILISQQWNEFKLHCDKLSTELLNSSRQMKKTIQENKLLIDNLNDMYLQWIENYSVIKLQLDDMFLNNLEENVFWIENNEQFNNNVFLCSPVDVSKLLNEKLFSNLDSVILTSATLNSNDNFNHIKQTTGLDFDISKTYGSPFDYDNSVDIIMPQFIPEPNSENYLEEINKIIYEYVFDTGGKAMALFTSYKTLRDSSKILKEKLAEHDINVLAQGVDGSPYQIIKRFKRNPNSLILGTSSFWEGVDIDNGSLNLLIITKLPFDVPTHPLFQARAEKYKNSFYDYSIPRAIIKFKQGFGRLIRNENDFGKVLLLDSRINTKRYGKLFINSLPGGKIDYKQQDYFFD
jgi:ATP-dependent DNA helicase DinG